MIIYPAIDIFEGKAVRLLRGDYSQMTVYSDSPASVAASFASDGATHLHIVDLEGAAEGREANFDTVHEVIETCRLFTEVGGGIRSGETIEKYLSAGASRVILGTAATENFDWLTDIVREYGEKIAVGVDIRDKKVAVRGWRETTDCDCYEFCGRFESVGVKTIICTDISRDGAMRGTNRELYRELSEKFGMDIIASGGVSTLEDVKALTALNIHGAIIGKALYTGNIKLSDAIKLAARECL